jgi:hypothetical protein
MDPKISRALSPGVKGPRSEADLSPPSMSKLKIRGIMPPLPHKPSWRAKG